VLSPFLTLILLVGVLGGVLVAGVGLARRVRAAPGRAVGLDRPEQAALDSASRRAGLRLQAAVLVAVGVLVAATLLGTGSPDLLGLPLAVAPAVAAAAGLLTFAALPAAQSPALRRASASLERRRPWSAASRADLVVPLVLAGALVATLVAGGALGAADETGRSRQFALTSPDPAMWAASGPFPGWFYAGPMIVATVLLLAAALAALARIASAPALPVAELGCADRRWRATSTRVVSRLTSAALSASLGGVLVTGGISVRSAAVTMGLNGVAGFRGLAGLGLGLAATGPVLVLLGCVALGRACMEAAGVRALTHAAAGRPAGAPVAP